MRCENFCHFGRNTRAYSIVDAFRKQVRSFNNPFAESNAEFRVWGDAASDYELPDTETQEKTEEEKEQEQRLIDQNSALELVVALQAHPFAYCQAHIHFMNHQKT